MTKQIKKIRAITPIPSVSLEQLQELFFPIGSIVYSADLDTEAKIKERYGGTTWEKIEGRFLLGQSSSYAANSTGGESTHKLTTSEMPNHTHGVRIGGAGHGTLKLGAYFKYWHDTPPGVNNGYEDYSNFVLTAGNSQPHNNMPPYKTVYIWQRTA